MAISASDYFQPDEEYLRTCREHKSRYMCQLTMPISNIGSKPSCETALLVNSKVVPWKLCDIRVTLAKGTYWRKLQSHDAWLYSTLEEQELNVFCDGHDAVCGKLSGVGVLQLRGGCVATAGATKLMALQTTMSQEMLKYQPTMGLNLSVVSPESTRPEVINLLKAVQAPYERMGSKNWDLSDNSVKLEGLEAQARELEERSEDISRSRLVSYSAAGGSFSLFGILAVACGIYVYIGKKGRVSEAPQPVRSCMKKVTCKPSISVSQPVHASVSDSADEAMELQNMAPPPQELLRNQQGHIWPTFCRV